MGRASPITPTIIRTQPAMLMLKPDGVLVTAKARMAPTAMSASPAPVFMGYPFLGREGDRRTLPLRGNGLGYVQQAAPQVRERPAEQPGHMHLGDAQLRADLGLGQIPVEPHDENALLTLGQLVPVGRDGV